MSFIGRSSFERPVTCAWSPPLLHSKKQEKLLATATLDGGGVGFGDVDSDFFSNLALNEIDLATGELVERNSVKVHNQRFASLAWGKQGLIAGGMTDGSVKLWTASTLAHKTDLSAGNISGNVFIRAMQFHPNSSVHQLAHSGAKKQVMVTDISTLSVLLETAPQAGEVSAVAWNLADAAKHIFASGNLDSTTAVWDLRTKKPTCEIRDPRGASITCLAWSPNPANSYHLLLANDSGMLRLFDLRSSTSTPMTEVQATTASNVGIFDLDWCPQDDNLLVTCSKDNRMLLWDMGTNQVLCEMHQDSTTQHLHQQTSNRRYQVDWSPTTPGLIAACSFDRSLQLFSVNNTLPRCPAWVKHSGKGARFGFGGRLVEFATDQQVTLSNVHEDAHWSDLLEFERKLEVSTARDQEAQTRDHLLLFCAEQEAKASSGAIKEIWQVLRVLLADNPRTATQKFLGYDEEDILATTGVDYSSPQAQQEEAIVRALTIGRFDLAVDLCFACKRYDEALYLAGMGGGGSELLMQAQERFALEKQTTSRVMQLAKSIANPTHAGAEDWKQQVALLLSFVTSPEEFAAQVNLVAQSQELKPQMVCYMLARNVNKVGECWARVIPEDDEFCEIGQVFSRVLSSPEEFQMDRVMMNRFARLANKMADEGKFDLAKKYATIAAGVDYEAADLVQRIEYGLVWTAESEARAREEEERWRAQQEAEEKAQAEQAAALAQQQAEEAAAYEQQQALYAQQQAEQAVLYAQQQQHYQQPQQQQYGAPPAYGYQQPAVYHPPVQQQAYAQQQPIYNAPVQQHAYMPPPSQQAYAPPTQQAYMPPPQPTYAPPPQQAYVPPPQPTYAPPPQQGYVPPQIPSYAPPPVAPAPAPVQHQQAYQTPPYVAPAAYAQAPPPSPPAQQPRVPENDGFGTTAGNASAGDKYGNRTVNRSAPAPAPVAPRPVDPALQAAVSTLQRSVQQLKQRYSAQAPGSMEERRLLEAEKGITALANSLPTLNDFFQQKLKELAGAVERSKFSEAHNIQLTLSSSSDWKEHKEWIKGLSHLIGVAQKDSQPKPAANGAGGSAAAYRGPPMSGGPPTSYPPVAQYPPVYQ